jgi:hypothetical protein
MKEEIGIELNLNRAFRGFNKYFVDNLNYRDKITGFIPISTCHKKRPGKAARASCSGSRRRIFPDVPAIFSR